MEKPGTVDPVALAATYGENPRRGGHFANAMFENWSTLDFTQGVGANAESQTAMMNGLVQLNPYDWTDAPMADLAHSWDISNNGNTYTFHLHEGVTFHDGMPVTSADFLWTFNRIWTKGLQPDGSEACGSCRNSLFLPIIESFEAPDANTFVINMVGPSGAVLNILASGYYAVMPKHIGERDPANSLRETDPPIGSGPWRLTGPTDPNRWDWEANPDYFKAGYPFMDTMAHDLILDIQTRATAVLTERIFWNHIAATPFLGFETAKSIAEQDSGIVHIGLPGFLLKFFTMNSTRAPFDDVRVRQAFAEAIDKNQLLAEDPSTGIEGLGPSRGVIGMATYLGNWAMPQAEREKLIGYGPDMAVRQQNARDLLADYEAENGPIDWSQVSWTAPTNHPGLDWAQLVQDMMKRVGVDGWTIEPKEIIATWTAMTESDFIMSGMFGLIDMDDPMAHFSNHFLQSGAWQFGNIEVPAAEALAPDLLFESNDEARKQTAWAMARLFHEQAAFNIIAWAVAEHIQRDYVKGYYAYPDLYGSHAKMEVIWLDKPELPLA
jgi:ABC-type transport system substrate-binding protein